MHQTLETTEFFLAAFLYSEGITLSGHSRDGNRSTFSFSGEEVNDLALSFYNETANTNVATFAKSIRQLKNIMYGTTTIQPGNNNERNIPRSTS
ncbi:MAG: DUF5659 domain-containing protein [Candidatus Marinimicrobia bacterium]|nr:DUF5659 domain-containing protein [Candidatus Neomarinimicrobiota bacterium]